MGFFALSPRGGGGGGSSHSRRTMKAYLAKDFPDPEGVNSNSGGGGGFFLRNNHNNRKRKSGGGVIVSLLSDKKTTTTTTTTINGTSTKPTPGSSSHQRNSNSNNNNNSSSITRTDLDIIHRQLEMARNQLEQRDELDETLIAHTDSTTSASTDNSESSHTSSSQYSDSLLAGDAEGEGARASAEEEDDDVHSSDDDEEEEDDDPDFSSPYAGGSGRNKKTKVKNNKSSKKRDGLMKSSRNNSSSSSKKKSSRSHGSRSRSRSRSRSIDRLCRQNVDSGGFPTDPSRVTLGVDMTVLADGVHLDKNTRTLLAVYDAKSIEDFFLMGEYDLNHLLAKARASNRGLPPLQIRKVKILREWIAEIVDETDPEKLPEWAKRRDYRRRRASGGGRRSSPSSFSDESDSDDPAAAAGAVRRHSLVPHDWTKRFHRDLPKLKKKLRDKGDSISEVFPWMSYVINIRDTLCGSAPKYVDLTSC